MNGLVPLAAALVAGLIEIALRGGPRALGPAPAMLRRLTLQLIVLGILISIAPLFPLVMDISTLRSSGELGILAGFILVSLLTLLPAWIWVAIVWKGSTTRSSTAFALAATSVNIGVAALMYRGFLSGDADSQDGIVVQLVPLIQLAVVASAAIFRYAGDTSLTKRAAKPSGAREAI